MRVMGRMLNGSGNMKKIEKEVVIGENVVYDIIEFIYRECSQQLIDNYIDHKVPKYSGNFIKTMVELLYNSYFFSHDYRTLIVTTSEHEQNGQNEHEQSEQNEVIVEDIEPIVNTCDSWTRNCMNINRMSRQT